MTKINSASAQNKQESKDTAPNITFRKTILQSQIAPLKIPSEMEAGGSTAL